MLGQAWGGWKISNVRSIDLPSDEGNNFLVLVTIKYCVGTEAKNDFV